MILNKKQRVQEIQYQQEEEKATSDSELLNLQRPLRQRAFPLKNGPIKILSAEDFVVDSRATQLIDWSP